MTILKRWYVAIALFIAVLLDGIIAFHFQGLLYRGSVGAACWFTVIGIVLIGLCDDQNVNNIWLSIGIGLIADCFYLGFIGVYIVIFPLICFCAQKIARYLPETFWARLIVCLFAYCIVNIFIYIIFSMVGIISLSFIHLLKVLLPSMLVCFVIFAITCRFWVWLSETYPFLDNRTQY